ncbi:hypothetical protein Fmac_016840 [Flemingia macrophylla]|uniref:WAT1-related protein n=1 Tax=Flemingia macrophylla TaxID=520843 RepID=A0ABD1MJ96_9FABA
MVRRGSFYMDFLPVVVIIALQFNYLGLLTLFKAATLQGMNNHVFVAYSYAVSTSLIFPITFLNRSCRSRVVPPLSFFIISKTILLGVIGSLSQIMGYAGISYSSPTLSASIANLVPAFTFMLAVIFRKEKIPVKYRSSQAKVLGSIISITGALVLTLYKGPSIIKGRADSHLSLSLKQPISFLRSGDANWAIAGILLTAEYLLISVCFVLQVDILTVFPDEVTLIFYVNVTGTVISTLVALFVGPNASAWKIGLNISLISILCSGTFQKVVGSIVSTWVLRLKGPVYVTSFTPFTVVIAVAMGVMFLGDTLHVGSLVGATIVSIGLYALLWGKAKEEIEEGVGSLESVTTENVPLLQSYGRESYQKRTDGNI